MTPRDQPSWLGGVQSVHQGVVLPKSCQILLPRQGPFHFHRRLPQLRALALGWSLGTHLSMEKQQPRPDGLLLPSLSSSWSTGQLREQPLSLPTERRVPRKGSAPSSGPSPSRSPFSECRAKAACDKTKRGEKGEQVASPLQDNRGMVGGQW